MRSLIAMYDDEIERARAEHQELVEVIQTVQDNKLRKVLTLHYIDGLPWEKTADRLFYSRDYVRGVFSQKALSAVYKIL